MMTSFEILYKYLLAHVLLFTNTQACLQTLLHPVKNVFFFEVSIPDRGHLCWTRGNTRQLPRLTNTSTLTRMPRLGLPCVDVDVALCVNLKKTFSHRVMLSNHYPIELSSLTSEHHVSVPQEDKKSFFILTNTKTHTENLNNLLPLLLQLFATQYVSLY